jgi:hypothetical protein
MLRGGETDGFGLALAAGVTLWPSGASDPAASASIGLRRGRPLGSDATLRSAVNAATERTWSRGLDSLLWRERIDMESGALRLFASAEGRIAALNERNIFALGGFLPRDARIVAATLLPGVAWRGAAGEIGVSLGLTQAVWLDGPDYLGLRRDNRRLQGNLFASTAFLGATLEGSASYLRIIFPDRDFDDETRLLYTTKARIPIGPLALDLSSARTAEDTTLPFSVVNLTTLHEAKLSGPLGAQVAAGIFVRRKRDDYLGLGARADQTSVGLELARPIDARWTATASAAWRRAVETGAPPVDAILAQVGLQARIDFARPAARR